MRSKRTKSFKALFSRLPADVQQQANAAYGRFVTNPTHPSLHFKRVTAGRDVYSVRVGIHYRALAVRRSDDLIWFWIGTHAEYDRLLPVL